MARQMLLLHLIFGCLYALLLPIPMFLLGLRGSPCKVPSLSHVAYVAESILLLVTGLTLIFGVWYRDYKVLALSAILELICLLTITIGSTMYLALNIPVHPCSPDVFSPYYIASLAVMTAAMVITNSIHLGLLLHNFFGSCIVL